MPVFSTEVRILHFVQARETNLSAIVKYLLKIPLVLHSGERMQILQIASRKIYLLTFGLAFTRARKD